MAEFVGGPCDGAPIEDDSVSTYVVPWHKKEPAAVYEFNPSTGNYHFNGFEDEL